MERTLPNRWLMLLIAVLCIANSLVYRALLAPHTLTVTVLHVGKGGAVLVRTPHGETLLIDTGPDAGILRALGTALPPWQRHLDAVIFSGTKTSLVGGLPEVERRYRIDTRVSVGGTAAPYGAPLSFDQTVIDVIAPGTLSISYGTATLNVSSSTPSGIYPATEKK